MRERDNDVEITQLRWKGDDENVVEDGNKYLMGWGYRHQQTAILFLCFTIAYSIRASMGVALVAMTENYEEALVNSSNTNASEFTLAEEAFDGLLFSPPYPKFQWSKKIQDLIQSSFFWGYMVLQIPAGMLAHKFGPRCLLIGSMMVNCVMSICLPWAAYYGDWPLTAIFRVIQGLSQSCVVPGLHSAFGKWAPLEERGRLTAFAYGGHAIGKVLGLLITGFVADSPLGWPGVFRLYGILSGLAGGLLWWLGADSPAQHKTISIGERRYIEEALGKSGQDEKRPVPWKKLFRSPGMYAIVIAHIGHNWGHLTLYSEVPAFMDKIMKVDIKANGLLTALPFFTMWLANFFFSYITDMIIVKKILSVTHTRKLASIIGFLPAGVGLIILAYVKKDIYVVETLLVVVCSCSIAANVGYFVNHIDIAPHFAGTMMSLSNFAANFVGWLAPLVAGFILTDVNSEELWRKVFFVSAGFYLGTLSVYLIFGTAELAEWNEAKVRTEDEGDPMLNKKGCSVDDRT